ncbi:hypothetical protein JHW43_000883 [Diplocarpon mali]|nr:hypothetical protein JHW43_000883 [Diplocarpon mali]
MRLSSSGIEGKLGQGVHTVRGQGRVPSDGILDAQRHCIVSHLTRSHFLGSGSSDKHRREIKSRALEVKQEGGGEANTEKGVRGVLAEARWGRVTFRLTAFILPSAWNKRNGDLGLAAMGGEPNINHQLLVEKWTSRQWRRQDRICSHSSLAWCRGSIDPNSDIGVDVNIVANPQSPSL